MEVSTHRRKRQALCAGACTGTLQRGLMADVLTDLLSSCDVMKLMEA